MGNRAPPPQGRVTEVHAPGGVVAYDPADLTVTVGAGTPVADVDALLAEHRQMCPLDPRDPGATVGGVLAVGTSGLRRLRYGPVRDAVLEVRFVTGDARLVKGGGPTVKNVTGYDLPRLLVGSFGTLGVLAQATLRCRPKPERSAWFAAARPAGDVASALFRPSAVCSDGRTTWVLLEGFDVDIAAEAARAGLEPAGAPAMPAGPHRGRASVAPGTLAVLGRELDRVAGAAWLAEWGVGTVHVAGDDAGVLTAARAAASACGGWLLREAGGEPGFDGFGVPLPNPELHRRIRDAFDPAGKCNPGRLP